MKEYILTSEAFEGEVAFGYDDNGYLKQFKNEAILTDAQRDYILGNLPKTLATLRDLVKHSKTSRLTERMQEVTFDMFWNKYNYKEDKAETIKVWGKMGSAEQQEAYQYIDRYNKGVQQNNVAKKYPKTYLRQKPWIR